MEEVFVEDGVRTRLILSGINELCEHGVRDFSLRRVAIAAEVSCAAPYRHFKDKDELILEIIRYIFSKWELLCREIKAVYSDRPDKLLCELVVANVGFWIANGNFRSILMLEAGEAVAESARAELKNFDAPITEALSELAACRGFSAERTAQLEFFISTLIYGAVMIVTMGKISRGADAINMVREHLCSEIM